MQPPLMTKTEVDMVSVEMWGQYQRLWEGSEGINVVNRLQVLTFTTLMLIRKWITDNDDRKAFLAKFPAEIARLDALATMATAPKKPTDTVQ